MKLRVKENGNFDSDDEYVSGTVGRDIVTLDGVYNSEDLRKIIELMKRSEQ